MRHSRGTKRWVKQGRDLECIAWKRLEQCREVGFTWKQEMGGRMSRIRMHEMEMRKNESSDERMNQSVNKKTVRAINSQ